MTSRPACVDEDLEDLVLARRQVDRPAADGDRAPADVEREVADPDDAVGVRGRPGRPAQERVDPRPQLGHAERLGHVVVGAEVEGRDLVRLAVARRQDEDRRRRLAPDAADDASGRPRSGRPRSSTMRSGRRRSQAVERRRGVAGLDDVVAVSARGTSRSAWRVASSSSTSRIEAAARGVVTVASAGSAAGSCRFGRGDRQVDVDRETAEVAPPRRDPAAHRLDEAADDGQADARPAPRALALARHAVELLEQARQGLGRDARPAVLDRDPDAAVVRSRAPRPGSAPRARRTWRRCRGCWPGPGR